MFATKIHFKILSYTILSKVSSESSSELSYFCSPFPEVTRVSVSCWVRISVSLVSDVDVDFGLNGGVFSVSFHPNLLSLPLHFAH